ncbi:MAG: orotidine-5'-phosphate decarboxylase [Proteobacteria bacterium]|nr:orotidine-5'-phosphate decarboxylase [Pseudomonadota bacterium]
MSESNLKARDRLVFPLDVPDWGEAVPLIETLRDHVGWFKVGLELFISRGPEAVRELRAMTGGRNGIFLDLKLHDIPATVGRAMAAAARLGADLVTVHAGDGRAMIEAARKEAGRTRVLAVTVLTSLDLAEELGLAPAYTEPMALVLLRARTAWEAGCHGLVCSGREVAAVRQELGPEPLIVTPGIRPMWSLVERDDQRRVVTPAQAIRAGADLIVVGRPIRDAEYPAAAAALVMEEIVSAM